MENMNDIESEFAGLEGLKRLKGEISTKVLTPQSGHVIP